MICFKCYEKIEHECETKSGMPNTEQKEWWEKHFDLMTKGDDSLGSSGWKAAPSTVKILMQGIAFRARAETLREVEEVLWEKRSMFCSGHDADKRNCSVCLGDPLFKKIQAMKGEGV